MQVFTLGVENEETVLAKLEAGSFFGEQALLSDTPGLRNASVRVLNNCVLLKISHDLFLRIVQADEVLKKELQKIGFQQLFLKLKAKESEYDISKYLFDEENPYETKIFNPGELIIIQGDTSKGVYFLLAGMVDVFKKNESGVEELISSIAPNNLFGEASMILDQPRQATVKAHDEVKALFIPPEKFRDLYQKHPELRMVVETLRHVYQSPLRGEMTQYIGHFLHMPSVISKFRLKKGREIISNRVVGKNIQSIRVSNIQNPQSFCYEDKTVYR